jgi:hypothetical protein
VHSLCLRKGEHIYISYLKLFWFISSPIHLFILAWIHKYLIYTSNYNPILHSLYCS